MKPDTTKSKLETSAYEDVQAQRLEDWRQRLEADGCVDDPFSVDPLDPIRLLRVARGALDELRCARTTEDRQQLKAELDDVMSVLGRRMEAN